MKKSWKNSLSSWNIIVSCDDQRNNSFELDVHYALASFAPLKLTFGTIDMTKTISYEPFDHLIVCLRNDALQKEAELLHRMIYKIAWTTGSELVGEPGHEIERIHKNTIPDFLKILKTKSSNPWKWSNVFGLIFQNNHMKKYNEKEILLRKLKDIFPNAEDRTKALDILYEYGKEKHEQEPDRVRLAILKISENKLESIKQNTMFAKQDFRDTLVAAEYPDQSKKWSMQDGPKKQKLIKKDRLQYEEWLNKDWLPNKAMKTVGLYHAALLKHLG
jgi:hypothetical protein